MTKQQKKTPATEYIVMTSSAKMPTNCWGRYGNVAVLEVLAGQRPKIITGRAKCVIRIVKYWSRMNIGTTNRCAFEIALRAANEFAAKMNAMAAEEADAQAFAQAEVVINSAVA